ncbi:hypothetical protein C8R45DRAFT_1000542, partial [Mycena sanguinolenta]
MRRRALAPHMTLSRTFCENDRVLTECLSFGTQILAVVRVLCCTVPLELTQVHHGGGHAHTPELQLPSKFSVGIPTLFSAEGQTKHCLCPFLVRYLGHATVIIGNLGFFDHRFPRGVVKNSTGLHLKLLLYLVSQAILAMRSDSNVCSHSNSGAWTREREKITENQTTLFFNVQQDPRPRRSFATGKAKFNQIKVDASGIAGIGVTISGGAISFGSFKLPPESRRVNAVVQTT